MKITNRQLRRFCYYAPIFCSMAVLSSQLQAGPTIQLNGDESRDGIADSGNLGYVGGNTRIGVSVDRDLQGQVDINQIIRDDDSSATSAEGWFGYQIKDSDSQSKGVDSGGAKLNHQWVNDEADTVHKVFGAYDRNSEDFSKATVGYGQETEDLFWSGHVSKSFGDEIVTDETTTRAYDYGVGGEVGTFIDSTQTRLRGGLDYEFGTEYADDEDRPTNLTISAGVEQYFYDTPHSVSLDVSGSRQRGGADEDSTDYNARLGYRYEFGGGGAYQSNTTTTRRRVEIPGTPARPGRAGRAAQPAVAARAAVAAQPGRPAQAAVAPRYERQLIKKPGHEFVKTTMKLENETFFKLNSSMLTASAKDNLNKIVSQVRGHGYIGAIRITGNTCGLGDPIYDQRLSENRANAVRDYLIDQGFNPEHLIARGLGKGSPKYDRNDKDFKNRRVDLEFMTERSTKKQSAQSFYKNVLVQEGRPAVAAIPARPGRPATPGRAAIPAIPAIPATPGTPSRFVWKTEVVKAAPVWIKRALRNTIKHNRTINTYTTRTAAKVSNDTFTLNGTDRTGKLDVLANDSSGSEIISVSSSANGGTVTHDGKYIYYVPRVGFTGTDSFTYTIKDRDGNEQTASVTVNVPVATNNAPTAADDVISTPEDTTVSIPVGENDSDPDGETLTTSVSQQPSNGSATVTGDGIISYTPNTGFSGQDTFEYTVTDGNGNTDQATVTVNVTNVNSAPVAADDAKTTNEDMAVTISVLDNDTDADGDALVVTLIGSPSNGSASVVDNEVVYTPDAGFSGSDTVDYMITDPDGQTSTATIKITVTNVNSAPKATDDERSTPEDTAVTIDALANDTDEDGDTLSIKEFDQPSNGSVTVNGTSFIYTPEAGFSGEDSFDYTIADPDGTTSTATVVINVTDVNSAPKATDDSESTLEATPVTINVLGNDSDPDGDDLKVTLTTMPANGTATVVNDEIVYTPNDGFSGPDSLTYTITDPDGETDTAIVNITVSNVNSAPKAIDDERSTPEDTAITIDALANDTDEDGDTLSIKEFDQPSNGSVTVNGTSFIYTPETGFSGEDSFDYTITDPDGSMATATVIINVTEVNSAPKATDDSESTFEDTPVTINVLGNDADPDGDELIVTIASMPANGTATVVNNEIVYTPNNGFSGPDNLTYTITDPDGQTDTALVNITVSNVNAAPKAVNDDRSTPEDTAITIDALANDSDDDGDAISIESFEQPSNGTVTVSGTSFVYTPAAGFFGEDSFDYTIADPDGSMATATVTITVTSENNAPKASSDSDTTPENTAVTVAVLANDSDPDGDDLTVTIDSMPSDGTASVVNGEIVYTPGTDFVGTDTLTYTITDPEGLSDTTTVTITVTSVNKAPVATNDSETTPQDTPITISVMSNDSDPDGDVISLVSNTSPISGSASISGTDIVYTPNAGFVGTDIFDYTITDSNGATVTATVTVTVTSTNEAPTAVDDMDTTPYETAITMDVINNDTDPDGDTLTITNDGAPKNGRTTTVDNKVVYTPDTGFVGVDTYTYTVSDGNGHTATATGTVTVEGPINEPPTADNDSATTPQDTAITIDVLANDTDPDGDTLTITSDGSAPNGTTTTSGNKIIYTPEAGFVGTDTFTYTISDGNGNTTTAVGTVTVTAAANQPPVAVDDSASTAFETPVTINVAANDTDPDGSTTCVSDIVTAPINGSVSILTTGTDITYTPFNGFSGTDTFVYTACDADGGKDTATVTVTVAEDTNVNQPPTLSPNYAAIQGYFPVTIRVLADDTDPDGDTLTLVDIPTAPSNGTAEISGDTVIYTANDNFVGSDFFYYEVSDGNGNTATERVDIDVRNDNTAPVVAPIPAMSADLGSTTTLDIDSYLSDADGDTVYLAVADALSGTINFSGTVLQYTPNSSEVSSGGTDTIYITVSDGQGGITDSQFTVNVN